MNQKEKQKAKELIVKGELKRGIIFLLSNNLSQAIRQEAELLSSRLNEIEKRNREGILREDDYVIERNKIRKSVIHLIDQGDLGYYTDTKKEKWSKNQLWLKRLLLMVMSLLILLFSAYYFLTNLENENSNKLQVSEDKKVDTTNIQSTIPNPNEQVEKKDAYQSKPKGNQERKKESIQLPRNSENTSKKLFNGKFKGTLAIVDIESENGMSNILFDLLSKAQFKATTSFFRSEFFKVYKAKFWQHGTEVLEEISIPKNLKCVCIVKEGVKYETRERLGHEFTTAKGEVELKILSTISGEATTLKIPVGGSGADNRRAYESYQSNFIIEFTKNNYLQKFESCKK